MLHTSGIPLYWKGGYAQSFPQHGKFVCPGFRPTMSRRRFRFRDDRYSVILMLTGLVHAASGRSVQDDQSSGTLYADRVFSEHRQCVLWM